MFDNNEIQTILSLIDFFECFDIQGDRKLIQQTMETHSRLRIKLNSLLNKN